MRIPFFTQQRWTVQYASLNDSKMDQLLGGGWEPFATATGSSIIVFFRKRV